MKFSLLVPILLALSSVKALDFATIPENDPKALRLALEAAGGAVGGEPALVRETGPGGKEVQVFIFPDPESYVALPVTPDADFWNLKVSIRIDEEPYGKSGGTMVGLHFGPNDSILSISADKWSANRAPLLISGTTPLLPEKQFHATEAMNAGDWRQISMGINGNEWHLQIGKMLAEKGSVENDDRSALSREGTLLIRLGNFSGAATLPILSEP